MDWQTSIAICIVFAAGGFVVRTMWPKGKQVGGCRGCPSATHGSSGCHATSHRSNTGGPDLPLVQHIEILTKKSAV